jgi:hypothetical protein
VSAVGDADMVKRKHMTWLERTPRLNDDQTRTAANSLLVNAFLMLTASGEVVAAWMAAKGIPVPDMPAPKGSLIKPVARWLGTLSHDDAAGLLAQAQAEQDTPVRSKGQG